MTKHPLRNLNALKEMRGLFERRKSLLSEINVTPFVDVMLVLLVIFMITAPLMQQGIDVQLPKAAAPAADLQQIPTVSLKSNKKIYWNQEELPTLMALSAKLDGYGRGKKDAEIYFRADKALDYGFVVKVLASIQTSGITRIGMVTESPDL